MKFKHLKQHQNSKREQVQISLSTDRFGNLTLTATLGEVSKSLSHIRESAVAKLSQKLTKELLANS